MGKVCAKVIAILASVLLGLSAITIFVAEQAWGYEHYNAALVSSAYGDGSSGGTSIGGYVCGNVTILANENLEVEVTNEGQSPDMSMTGVLLQSAPLIIGAVVVGGMAIIIASKVKRDQEDDDE